MTLRDLKRCKLSGNFFNVLFNMNKFVAFEMRDPNLIRQVMHTLFFNCVQFKDVSDVVDKNLQEREQPTLTEWDRFAHHEYIRLSMEENGEDVSHGSGEVWDEPLGAPF